MHRLTFALLATASVGCHTFPPPAPRQPGLERRTVDMASPAATDVEEAAVRRPTVHMRLEHTRVDEKAEIDTAIPVLTSSDDRMRGALAHITEDLRDLVARNVATIEDYAAEQPEAGGHYALHITCRPTLISTAMVSIACDGYQYLGGAHGSHGTTGHNYLLTSGGAQAVALSDLLERAEDGSATIAALAVADLDKQGATFVVDGSVATLPIEKLENFTFSPDGLVLHFAPYVVGSYVEGDYEVMIPYDELTPLLRKGPPRRAIAHASSDPGVNIIVDYEAAG